MDPTHILNIVMQMQSPSGESHQMTATGTGMSFVSFSPETALPASSSSAVVDCLTHSLSLSLLFNGTLMDAALHQSKGNCLHSN